MIIPKTFDIKSRRDSCNIKIAGEFLKNPSLNVFNQL